MQQESESMEVLMKRLDVLCSVVETALQPGGRATKHDLRLMYKTASKVVAAYYAEKEKK